MRYDEFVHRMKEALQPGIQLSNPGGGISTVKSLVFKPDRDNLYYIRGRSTMQVSLRDFYEAFTAFRGTTCETTALKQFRPQVFDSAAQGHSCNCTMFLLVLQKAGLAGEISGAGVRGNPFRATIS